MSLEEFTVDQNNGYISPVTANDSVAQVAEAKKQALAEKVSIESESGGIDGKPARGNAEADLIIDIGLEAIGLKSAASAVQLVGGRMVDTMETRNSARSTIEEEVQKASRAPGTYKPSLGEDLLARANIATSSLDLDTKHVNTDKWSGTDTKMGGVALAKSLTVSKSLANEKVLDSVFAVERQHQAMLGHINQMVPGMSLGSGPSINPARLLSHAETVSDMEDWQRRLAEQAGTGTA